MIDYKEIFLLDRFFYHEDYPGWRNIATKLIQDGSCIVAGNECIWRGGVGNFIQTEPAKNAVDCLLYEFDLAELEESAWYNEIKGCVLDDLNTQIHKLERQRTQISA